MLLFFKYFENRFCLGFFFLKRGRLFYLIENVSFLDVRFLGRMFVLGEGGVFVFENSKRYLCFFFCCN